MKRLLSIVAVFFLTMVVGETGAALPRFQSRTGAKCQSCHVNPSGGGMRQAFGQQYGRETLPVPTWSEEFGLDDFSTKLTESVSIGADVRTLFYYIQDPTKDKNAFYEMQGDVYLNFKLAKKIGLYVEKGLSTNNFELFGLLNVLPANGFIKVGRFIPNFGMKVDEHRVFTRQYTGFSQETANPYNTGLELAFSPGPATITGGIYNSQDGVAPGIGNQKAFLGRAEAIIKASEEVNIGVGANLFYKNIAGTKSTLFGGFGSFSYGDLTLMGEIDWVKKTIVGDTTAFVLYAEADYVLTPGLDLKFIYDFYDPNKDLKTGSMSRLSFGFEFFPISGVEVRPLYRILTEDPHDAKNNEFNLVVHFYL